MFLSLSLSHLGQKKFIPSERERKRFSEQEREEGREGKGWGTGQGGGGWERVKEGGRG